MKTLKGLYKKSDNTERDIQVYVLENKVDHFSGLDLTYLNEEEILNLKNISDTYYSALEPYFKKCYRQFKRENIKNVVDEII